MSNYNNKWTLITGASAGIGEEFARNYARRGSNIVLVARREQRLVNLAKELSERFGVQTHVIVEDLADPSSPQRIFDNTTAHNITVDILVNNAGFGFKYPFLDCDWPRIADGLQVMLTAVLHLTHLYLPAMKKQGYGRILNISSVVGLMSGYYSSNIYGVIKKSVIEFSKMIQDQAVSGGVFVSAVCPGLTRTEFHQVADTAALRESAPSFMWKDVKEVVNEAIEKNEKNNTVIIPGLIYRVINALIKIIPGKLIKNRSPT